ncbi:MAG: hypothetical protein ABIF71_09220 [Planctomycetota bacterium]
MRNIIGGLVLGLILLAQAGVDGQDRNTNRCKNNLRQIGTACAMYAMSNDENYPPNLQAMVPDQIADTNLFMCPACNMLDSYVYLPGLTANSPTKCILAFDRKGNHAKGRNVLFVDAHVEFMDEDAFLKRVAAMQQPPFRESYNEAALQVLQNVLNEAAASATGPVPPAIPGTIRNGVGYFRKGATGAFYTEIALTPAPDLAQQRFMVKAADDKVYSLFVDFPGADLAQVERMETARESYNERQYAPEVQARMDAIRTEQNRIQEEMNKDHKTINQLRQEIAALDTLVKSIPEGEGARAAVRREAVTAMEEKQASLKVLQKESEAREEALRPQMQKLQEEQSGLYRANERMRPAMDEGASQDNQLKVAGCFKGTGKAKVTIYMQAPGDDKTAPQLFKELDLDLSAQDEGDRGVVQRWADLRARNYAMRAMRSPYTSYFQYCVQQSPAAFDIPGMDVPFWAGNEGGQRGPRGVDPYALTTGALAIQETLQLEEMRGGGSNGSKAGDQTVDIATLEGPAVKSHPFAEMLKGREPAEFPVAALVPFDNYYCRFDGIKALLEVTDLMDAWGTSLMNSLAVTARDADLLAKYRTQLCIDLSDLTRLFGDMVIGEIACTGSDPFLMEGTDVAVIIAVKKRPVFDLQFGGYLARAVKEAGAQRTEGAHAGVPIVSVQTDDRQVSSHSAYLGDYKVVANSPAALHRVIDTFKGTVPSMAANLDLKYMRTIFPAKAGEETGFVYMADPFIRRLLSPQWKIEARRRMTCQTHLRMLDNAVLMFREEQARMPALAELTAGKYIPDNALVCPDGGTCSLGADGRPVCSIHNRLRYCTPVAEVAIVKATPGEAEDYKQFVNRYNNYWSRYFDPIGIRLKQTNDRLEIETCILPLIENTIYNQVREFLGGAPVQLNSQVLTGGTIASLGWKIKVKDSELDQFLTMWGAAFLPGAPAVQDCLGESMSFSLFDNDVLFTVNNEGLAMLGGWMNMRERMVVATLLSALNLPICVTVDIRNPAMVRTLLDRGMDSLLHMRGQWVNVQRYDAGPYNGHAVTGLDLTLYVIKFRLFYAVTETEFVIATKRFALEQVLDTLDGPKRPAAATANLGLRIQPPAFQRLRPAVEAGWQESMRDACLKNLEPVAFLIRNCGADLKQPEAPAWLATGYAYRCSSAGTYTYDPLTGEAACSVHGTPRHPSQPVQPAGNEPFFKFLDRLQDLQVLFKFTDEGIMTKIALMIDRGAK